MALIAYHAKDSSFVLSWNRLGGQRGRAGMHETGPVSRLAALHAEHDCVRCSINRKIDSKLTDT